MALFSIEGVFTWGRFLTLKKKSTPNVKLTVHPFSIVIFTWGFNIGSLNVSLCRLDLAVPFTPFTPNRQNRNHVCWNICAGVLRLLRLPRWCRQNSHVTCSKTRWYKVLRFFSVFPDRF